MLVAVALVRLAARTQWAHAVGARGSARSDTPLARRAVAVWRGDWRRAASGTTALEGLATRTVGSVAGAGEVLLEIVPIEDDMVAEIKIDPKDIGHLKLGQDAQVKITTYDVSRLGTLHGTLMHISASTFQNEQGEYFYKGTIALAQNHVGQNPKQNLILPGMVVDADINTGAKSLLRYLLRPVFRSLDTAFSER